MAEISSLLTLQGQLALLTLIGFFSGPQGHHQCAGTQVPD